MTTPEVSSATALAWRWQRHGLLEGLEGTIPALVERVVALRGWPAAGASLACAVRQRAPDLGALDRALATGDVIRSYAFGGGSYVMAHGPAARVLAVHTASRTWEKARFQAQARFALDDWDLLRSAMREVLADGPRTREQIRAALADDPALPPLGPAASGLGADTLYKPLHWWGDICFGPTVDGVGTFQWLADDPRWSGPLDVDDAGRGAVRDYLAGYGPATVDNLLSWLGGGLGAPRRRVLGWIADMQADTVEIAVDGVPRLLLREHLDELRASEPTDAVRLLPAYDPWVLGPGTKDELVVPAALRSLATHGRRLVIAGGVVVGSWTTGGPHGRPEIDAPGVSADAASTAIAALARVTATG